MATTLDQSLVWGNKRVRSGALPPFALPLQRAASHIRDMARVDVAALSEKRSGQ